jgi:hypothetical protein
MRNKFSELIEQGVAKFDYTPIASNMPEQDPVCRMYNNIWSIPSDTHMGYNEETGERYITGHMVGIEDRWCNFVHSQNWGAVSFRPTGYWSLCDFLQKQGLCGRVGRVNGDVAYIVTPIQASETDGCPECPTTCTTTESRIPQPIAVLTSFGDVYKVMECFEDKNNIYEVCEALNKSHYVRGNEWTVSEGKLLCPIGNKVYVL